ncbi:MAG: hypothetical protein ACI4RH_00885 [Huintestinicola sp.]
MELSYEETMQRIAEYEKKDIMGYKYCKEKRFPWLVDVFKGEHQLFVVPYITTIGYYYTSMAWYRILSDNETPDNIGKAVLDAFEHIRISPVDARTRAERNEDSFYLKETKCKSYKAFNKKYICCSVRVKNEQMEYRVSTSINSFDNNGYCGIEGDEPVTLPNIASSTDIGNAVINAFRIIEEYKKSQKPDPYPPVDVELLSDQKVEIHPPRDRHFTDMQDGGAAEIYRLYEYSPKEGAEPSANFYLGIAAELDCDLGENNIREALENQHGKADFFEVKSVEHGIFKLRAEMRNKKVHRISYLLQIDESELFDCTMELHKPNSRKKLDEKLTGLFEEFAFKCRYKI